MVCKDDQVDDLDDVQGDLVGDQDGDQDDQVDDLDGAHECGPAPAPLVAICHRFWHLASRR